MSPLTLQELKEKLIRLNVEELLEILQIDAEMIVEHFDYLVEEHIERLEKEIDDYE